MGTKGLPTTVKQWSRKPSQDSQLTWVRIRELLPVMPARKLRQIRIVISVISGLIRLGPYLHESRIVKETVILLADSFWPVLFILTFLIPRSRLCELKSADLGLESWEYMNGF